MLLLLQLLQDRHALEWKFEKGKAYEVGWEVSVRAREKSVFDGDGDSYAHRHTVSMTGHLGITSMEKAGAFSSSRSSRSAEPSTAWGSASSFGTAGSRWTPILP
jgi:hypothetical protein